MSLVTIHKEMVKGRIRAKFGTLEVFAQACRLKPQAVRDTLRGTSSRAKAPIAALFGVQPDQLIISQNSTDVEFDSSLVEFPHRQNAEAR